MTAPRLLIIDDDAGIAQFLTVKGYDATVRPDCSDLPAHVRKGDFALVIPDRMLPDAEGAELCRQLRSQGEDIIVLMLTARDALDDKLSGFRVGADDYMNKHFAFEELLARIEVLLRRAAVASSTLQPRNSRFSAISWRMPNGWSTAKRSCARSGITVSTPYQHCRGLYRIHGQKARSCRPGGHRPDRPWLWLSVDQRYHR